MHCKHARYVRANLGGLLLSLNGSVGSISHLHFSTLNSLVWHFLLHVHRDQPCVYSIFGVLSRNDGQGVSLLYCCQVRSDREVD